MTQETQDNERDDSDEISDDPESPEPEPVDELADEDEDEDEDEGDKDGDSESAASTSGGGGSGGGIGGPGASISWPDLSRRDAARDQRASPPVPVSPISPSGASETPDLATVRPTVPAAEPERGANAPALERSPEATDAPSEPPASPEWPAYQDQEQDGQSEPARNDDGWWANIDGEREGEPESSGPLVFERAGDGDGGDPYAHLGGWADDREGDPYAHFGGDDGERGAWWAEDRESEPEAAFSDAESQGRDEPELDPEPEPSGPDEHPYLDRESADELRRQADAEIAQAAFVADEARQAQADHPTWINARIQRGTKDDADSAIQQAGAALDFLAQAERTRPSAPAQAAPDAQASPERRAEAAIARAEAAREAASIRFRHAPNDANARTLTLTERAARETRHHAQTRTETGSLNAERAAHRGEREIRAAVTADLAAARTLIDSAARHLARAEKTRPTMRAGPNAAVTAAMRAIESSTRWRRSITPSARAHSTNVAGALQSAQNAQRAVAAIRTLRQAAEKQFRSFEQKTPGGKSAQEIRGRYAEHTRVLRDTEVTARRAALTARDWAERATVARHLGGNRDAIQAERAALIAEKLADLAARERARFLDRQTPARPALQDVARQTQERTKTIGSRAATLGAAIGAAGLGVSALSIGAAATALFPAATGVLTLGVASTALVAASAGLAINPKGTLRLAGRALKGLVKMPFNAAGRIRRAIERSAQVRNVNERGALQSAQTVEKVFERAERQIARQTERLETSDSRGNFRADPDYRQALRERETLKLGSERSRLHAEAAGIETGRPSLRESVSGARERLRAEQLANRIDNRLQNALERAAVPARTSSDVARDRQADRQDRAHERANAANAIAQTKRWSARAATAIVAGTAAAGAASAWVPIAAVAAVATVTAGPRNVASFVGAVYRAAKAIGNPTGLSGSERARARETNTIKAYESAARIEKLAGRAENAARALEKQARENPTPINREAAREARKAADMVRSAADTSAKSAHKAERRGLGTAARDALVAERQTLKAERAANYAERVKNRPAFVQYRQARASNFKPGNLLKKAAVGGMVLGAGLAAAAKSPALVIASAVVAYKIVRHPVRTIRAVTKFAEKWRENAQVRQNNERAAIRAARTAEHTAAALERRADQIAQRAQVDSTLRPAAQQIGELARDARRQADAAAKQAENAGRRLFGTMRESVAAERSALRIERAASHAERIANGQISAAEKQTRVTMTRKMVASAAIAVTAKLTIAPTVAALRMTRGIIRAFSRKGRAKNRVDSARRSAKRTHDRKVRDANRSGAYRNAIAAERTARRAETRAAEMRIVAERQPQNRDLSRLSAQATEAAIAARAAANEAAQWAKRADAPHLLATLADAHESQRASQRAAGAEERQNAAIGAAHEIAARQGIDIPAEIRAAQQERDAAAQRRNDQAERAAQQWAGIQFPERRQEIPQQTNAPERQQDAPEGQKAGAPEIVRTTLEEVRAESGISVRDTLSRETAYRGTTGRDR